MLIILVAGLAVAVSAYMMFWVLFLQRIIFVEPKAPEIPDCNSHKIEKTVLCVPGAKLTGWLATPANTTSNGAVLYFNGRHESPTSALRLLKALPDANHKGMLRDQRVLLAIAQFSSLVLAPDARS